MNLLPLSHGHMLGDFRVLRHLGHGSFGHVYKALNTKNNTLCALKTIGCSAHNKDDFEAIVREIVLMSKIEHDNVLKVIDDPFVASDLVIIPLELCSNGTLQALIEKIVATKTPISIKDLHNIFLQCAKGVEAIHKAGIIHRDIKPMNILLSGDNTIKIADLGISKLVGPNNKTDSFVGTLQFLAPEVASFVPYDSAVDIWSLGTTFKLFYERNLLASKGTPLEAQHKKYNNLFLKMIQHDPNDRITSSELVLYLEKLSAPSFAEMFWSIIGWKSDNEDSSSSTLLSDKENQEISVDYSSIIKHPIPPSNSSESDSNYSNNSLLSSSSTSENMSGSKRYSLQIVKDTPIPKVEPNTKVIKSWIVKNSGTEPWPEQTCLKPITDKLNTSDILLPATMPGQEIEVTVEFTAPNSSDTQYFRACLPNGKQLGQRLWIDIEIIVP